MALLRLLAALLMCCASLAEAQTLTPFLLHDVNPSVRAQTQQLFFPLEPNADNTAHDDLFYVSESPTRGLWHGGTGDAANYFVGDAYRSVSSGALTYFWNDAFQVTLQATDGSTSGTRTLGQFPGFYGAARCGTKTCFSAGNNLLGVTDGTASGSAIIASTEPSVTNSNMPLYLASTGDVVYFKGFDNAHGRCFVISDGSYCGELWASDGTASGTHLVTDIIPGPFPSAPDSLFSWGGKVYFTAFAGDLDLLFRLFYVSDGTAAGTRPLTRDAIVSRGMFGSFAGSGKYVYFGSSQLQYWRTEGTPESTVGVRDLAHLGDPAWVVGLVASPEAILFTVTRELSTSTFELWFYDGTRAVKLRDISSSNTSLLGYLPSRQRFYYAIIEKGDTEQTLYETDGTSAGRMVSRLAGVKYSLDFSAGAHIAHFTTYDGGQYKEVWQTDGTASGTHPVHNETMVGNSSNPTSLVGLPNRLLFFADDGQSWKLFSSDGIGPAVPVSPPVTCRFPSQCVTPVVRDGQVYLQRDSGWWTVDGVDAVPLSKSFGGDGTPLTLPVRLGNSQYLIGYTGSEVQLWRKDAAAVTIVKSFPTSDRSRAASLVSTGKRLFFSDYQSLWTSDGTAAGTLVLLNDVEALLASDSGVYFQHIVNGKSQTWFSDGTVLGTTQVAIATDLSKNFLTSFTVWHDMLFFIDANTGRLWRTRPGADETIELPHGGGYLVSFVDLGDRLAAIWSDEPHSCEVWLTDGTTNMTVLQFSVDDVRSVLPAFRLSNGDVYLPLWSLGKRIFLNLRSGKRAEMTGSLFVPAFEWGEGSVVAVGTRAIFSAETIRTGREVWAVDLGQTSRAPVPVASVTFSGITSLQNQRAAVFRITLTGASATACSFRFETNDGTLRAARDYTATTGLMAIPSGQNVRSIIVPVSDAGGTFNLVLTQPDNVEIAAGFVTATIPPAAVRRRPSRP